MSANPEASPDGRRRPSLFDLPQEIREMIYAYFPFLASIHINQDPQNVFQPALSRVCRDLRKECLDHFYSKNVFWLDMRGWKHSTYPHHWTPRMIFDRWIVAIGDDCAARLRNMSFFSHNFSLNIKMTLEKPTRITLRFRTFSDHADVAEGVASTYKFVDVAARVQYGLQTLLQDLEEQAQHRRLRVADFVLICETVEKIQPFLCRRMALGYRGAILSQDGLLVSQWPDTTAHRNRCDDCGYLRFTQT